jgi:hypothetical protein
MSEPSSPPDPTVVAAIRHLVDDLRGRDDHGDLARRLEALIELLVLRGALLPEHRAWLAELTGDRTSVKLALGPPKRTVRGPDLDCAALLPLCRGRCCSFAVTLTREDLLEGRLRFDVHDPYALPRDPDTGYCSYLGRDGRCGCYDDRPVTCRDYDCRNDPRVWLDFANRVPAPLAEHLIPPELPPELPREVPPEPSAT